MSGYLRGLRVLALYRYCLRACSRCPDFQQGEMMRMHAASSEPRKIPLLT